MTAHTPFPCTVWLGSYEIRIEVDNSLPPNSWRLGGVNKALMQAAIHRDVTAYVSAFFGNDSLSSFTRIPKGYMSVKSFRRGSRSPVFWNVYGRKG